MASNTVVSRSEGNGNWDWGDPASWFYTNLGQQRSRPDQDGLNFVTIGHNDDTTMTLNGTSAYNINTLTIGAGASLSRIFDRDSTASLDLWQGFYNDSNGSQTFNAPVRLDASSIDFAINAGGSTEFTQGFVLNGNTASFLWGGSGTGTFTLSGVVEGTDGKITKGGSGTLTLSGNSANTYTGLTTVSAGTLKLDKTTGNAIVGNVTVSGGTLLLARSNQVDSSAGDTITLSGGTIRRGGANVSEAFGNLNITAESTLDFGTGGLSAVGYEFRFETYSNTDSKVVTVENFLPGTRLQFLSASFNSGNLTSFDFDNSYNTSIDGNYFTITAIPEPSTYVAAAGLLAMFLWPVRRRMIKDLKSILGLRSTGRERIEAYRNA